MSRFSMQFINNNNNKQLQIFNNSNFFNKNMNYYICSIGGCGSTVIFNYLKNFGNVYHIHDRYPPQKLKYVGEKNTDKDVYSEWFNDVDIPEDELKNYKVIFIYRHPIKVIFSRFAQSKGPNITHLQNIKCINNGNINIYDVIKFGKDFYGIEEFFDNYTVPCNRNYNIYAIKYELFWNNIELFNKALNIPDIKQFYPIKQENPKKISFIKELSCIYNSLINKMNRMRFIELIEPKKEENDIYSSSFL